MTTHFPDEAIHFRGKTLTPESPRPLHVAEPANIPVLQNQMDPIFNDTSTYERSESGQEGNNHHMYHADGPLSYRPYAASGNDVREDGVGREDSNSVQNRQPGSFHSVSLQEDGLMNRNDTNLSDAKAFPPSNQSSPAVAGTSVMRDTANNPDLTASPSDHHHNHHHHDPALLPPSVPGDPSQAPSDTAGSGRTLPQGISFASEVDTAVATSPTNPSVPHGRLENQKQEDSASNSGEGGVDFQNLLDNLSRPLAIASSGPTVVETVPSSVDDSRIPQATTNESPHPHSGLPPRPPPQEKPSIDPNYTPSDGIRSYHHLPPQNSSNTPTQYTAQQSNYQANQGLPPLAAAGAPGTSSGTNSLPPPPVASFQQTQPSATESQEASDQANQRNGRIDRQIGRQSKADEDTPWGPEVQKKYDEFLHDERVYVTEGLWDRFPPGSRLFVGNLPTERVTKRDLFHIFHKYGKLAQISIKQAYGFIQFLEASPCYEALEAEQGAVVRGRKIHLEISKPQRNTRQGPTPADPPSRGPQSRRSRSPEYGRSGPNNRNLRGPSDRYDRPFEPGRLPFSDFRDEHPHRRRDDYRPPRSPSPRGFRPRDDYRARDRDRTPPERYDRRERRRSRSPYGRDRRYRSPSPRPRAAYENDSDLPVPRRAPRDVPDVQILVLEDVDRNFVFHVENSFRSRGLRVDVLTLGPRIPLSAAVHRQINEGVRAIVKLSRSNQFSGKISLQLIDRSGGPDNVRFNDYPDIDIGTAAEVVFHAQSVQRSGGPAAYPVSPAFAVPQIPPVPVSQPALPALSAPSNVANLITSLDAPTLQSLLATLQQRQQPAPTAQQPFPVTSVPQAADLASLLSSATRQPHSIQPIPAAQLHPSLPSQAFPLQHPNAPVVPDPNLMSLLTKGLGGQPPQGQAAIGPNVQNIVNQLAKWKQ